MADFPPSPAPGTTYTAPDGTVWTWDSYSWKSEGGSGAGGLSTLQVSANSASTINANGINFVNTADIIVHVNSGATGNANVSYTIAGTVAGPQGIQGIQGTQGIQGVLGIQGATGAGAQGIQGIQGVQGTLGIQGATGAGTQGIQGVQGTQGIQGTLGIQGVQGMAGTSQGIQGIQGIQGVQGIQGIAGMRILNFQINGGGASIATGSTEAAQSKGYVATADAMNVASWKLYANASGALVVDVWTGSSSLGTMTLISGTNPPRLVAAQQNSSAGITGWSSGVIVAGNVLQFRVNSSATPTVETATVALTMNP